MVLKVFQFVTNKLNAFTTFILFKLVDYIAKFPTTKKYIKNSILIVRLDAIGDFILFRNFIEYLKYDPNYNYYDFYLCGNSIYKSLAENFDKAYIKDFFWIDKVKLNSNTCYRFQVLRYFHKIKFDIIINPQFSRDYYSESIIKCGNAPVKIASSGDLANVRPFQKRISDKYYTKIIYQNNPGQFEFHKNKDFFQKLLNKPLDIVKPALPILNSVKDNTIIIFPGAGLNYRRWHEDKFTEVAKFLLSKFKYKIILLGGKEDVELGCKIENSIKNNKLVNLIGQTSLPQTAEILSKSKFLIANETSIIHMAVAVNTPFLCISNGNHFGRFNPYPDEVFSKGIYVYPSYIKENYHNYNKLVSEFSFISELNINEIQVESITTILSDYLNL